MVAVLRWRGAKNIGIYGVFLFREREKSGGLQKVPTTKTTTTTTTGPSSNSYNNNNNNNDDDDDAADDDEDDDNNDNDDNDDNDDSYLVQMKSPSLFPSPDPYRHRRCAKLYNLYTHTYMLYMYVIYIYPKMPWKQGIHVYHQEMNQASPLRQDHLHLGTFLAN